MPRHRPVERRRAIFVAVEGQSDRAFIKFLGMCCEEKGLRLHKGHEQRNVPGQDALNELRKVWPEYKKSLPAEWLAQRFRTADLLRAARHDGHLQRLLDIFAL